MIKVRKNILKTLFVIVCLLISGQNYHGQKSENFLSKQIDKLFSAYDEKTPGVAVVVVKDGKIVFKKGYGTANLEYDIPISTKTVFNIASDSKQFTAFAVYLLEKQGKLSLEDDIRK